MNVSNANTLYDVVPYHSAIICLFFQYDFHRVHPYFLCLLKNFQDHKHKPELAPHGAASIQ